MQKEFKMRRDRLVRKHPDAVFLFDSAPLFLRNSDVFYPYRQDSNFYYLTGFEEPHSFLVLFSQKNSSGSKMVLFVRPREKEKELWEGERCGVDRAKEFFGADEVYPIEQLFSKLSDFLKGRQKVFFNFRKNYSDYNQTVAFLLEKKEIQVTSPVEMIGEMRLFKSDYEIGLLKKACQISAKAHQEVMEKIQPGMFEFEIEALINYLFYKEGCRRLAYGSIVAGGKNATCLHYQNNRSLLNAGDLILIDAGGEYEYYCADITRSYPIGGVFSPLQAKIYDWVLLAQKEAISMVRPGIRLIDIDRQVCEILVEGMLSLGFIKGSINEVLDKGSHRQFYPHRTSHWLGMDVHDLGSYVDEDGSPRCVDVGMVFTVEPGFYIQTDSQNTPMGIRIEDDLLVTEKGCEVLSAGVVKERSEIEFIRSAWSI